MTPGDYAAALQQLEDGTLPENQVAILGAAAAARLSDHPRQLAEQWSMAIQAYWHNEVERRVVDREAAMIADAAKHLRCVIEGAEHWRQYLQLPDAMLWAMAGANPGNHNVVTIALAAYLRALETYLRDGAHVAMWMQHGNPTGRKATLPQFVIRFVHDRTPATTRDNGTSGQRRYGRNAGIAAVCSALLARPVTRQQVGQAIKNTV